jgi:DNA-binding transcriptional LysR family regulator
MDLTQIRYFLALARTLNFTRAAEACNVTQPALTKSIQRLEDELGGPLLLRERLLTQLTPLGQAMLPLLEHTYAASERAKEHAASLKRDTASPLRVGFASDVPTGPFMPLFRELAAGLPGFELSVQDAPGAELAEALLHGALDAAVVTGNASLPDRLNRWPLFTDVSVLIVPPGHVLDEEGNDAVPLATLDGVAVILGGPGCGMGQLLARAGQGHGARPGQRHRADTPGRAVDLVRAGLGIAASTWREPLPPGLRQRLVAGQAPHEVLLVAVAGRPFPRAADAFIKLARARDWEKLDAAA